MANRLGSFIKKKLLGKDKNLVHLNDPYDVMCQLLKGHQVTGVIDAGASTGRISERLLRRFPKAQAYAFEPNPVFVKVLQAYAAKDPRFHPQFAALSDHDGRADLYITNAAGSTSLFTPAERLQKMRPKGSPVVNTQNVEIVTIDEWAKRNGNLSIELMKFDIQGGELQALRGAVRMLQNSTLLVYAEVWFNNMYNGGALFSELDLFFRQYGFLPYDMYKLRYDTKGLIVSGCVMFINSRKLDI